MDILIFNKLAFNLYRFDYDVITRVTMESALFRVSKFWVHLRFNYGVLWWSLCLYIGCGWSRALWMTVARRSARSAVTWLVIIRIRWTATSSRRHSITRRSEWLIGNRGLFAFGPSGRVTNLWIIRGVERRRSIFLRSPSRTIFWC